MRIALVDLLFCWPPHGGADVDVYQVASQLQAQGQEVHLFVTHVEGAWDQGNLDPEDLPFPATRLDFSAKSYVPRTVSHRIKAAVDAWKPDVVMVADAFFMKPHVLQALEHYPTVSRYYAYEAICHRSILHFKDQQVCPKNYLDDPETCRTCAAEGLAPMLKSDQGNAWTREYVAARAYTPEYYLQNKNGLHSLDAAVVYHPGLAQYLEKDINNIAVIPGGVDLKQFSFSPLPPHEDKFIFLMTGRGEDPVKGADILRMAGERLYRERDDFEIWVTMPEDSPATPWFKPIGWHSHDEILDLYTQAHVVVVPSIWEEPFGLVAVEAMACGRPVCASRVGGLQHIVDNTKTGFLFEAGDSADLAKQLSLLMGNPELRESMGKAGRERVEAQYTWEHIVRHHYIPLFESVLTNTGSTAQPC